MRIAKKTGQPARIELTAQERRVLAQAEDICHTVAHNAEPGDLRINATQAAAGLGVILIHLPPRKSDTQNE